MLGAMEGDLASPLLPSNAPIDLGSLHPELLKEVQHVVIAREDLLLHVNEIIGRGERTQCKDFLEGCKFIIQTLTQSIKVELINHPAPFVQLPS